MKNSFWLLSLTIFFTADFTSFVSNVKAQDYSFITLDNPCFAFPKNPDPKAAYGNEVTGILGNTVVGTYTSDEIVYGYTYSGGVFTTVEYPDWMPVNNEVDNGTLVTGIYGSVIVGTYSDSNYITQGFIERDGRYTRISHPEGVNGTWVTGVCSATVCGNYTDSNKHGYGFTTTANSKKYNAISHPKGEHGTWVAGISTSAVFGCYWDKNYTRHGFVRRKGGFTDVDHPNAAMQASNGNDGTMVTGVSGNSIVGFYFDKNKNEHGFLKVGGIFKTIDDPIAATSTSFDYNDHNGTEIHGILGTKIYGSYTDANGILHGFIASLPAAIINFDQPITPMSYSYRANFPLTATSTSGGAITYTSSSPSVISINGKTASIVGVGTASLTATVAATDNYESATETRSVTVNKSTTTITFAKPKTPATYVKTGKQKFTLIATSTSGGAITYTSSSPSVISINGRVATIKGAGTVTITATVAATDNYHSATATCSVTVK